MPFASTMFLSAYFLTFGNVSPHFLLLCEFQLLILFVKCDIKDQQSPQILSCDPNLYDWRSQNIQHICFIR